MEPSLLRLLAISAMSFWTASFNRFFARLFISRIIPQPRSWYHLGQHQRGSLFRRKGHRPPPSHCMHFND